MPLRWLLGAVFGLVTGQPVDLIRHGGFGYGQEHLALLAALCVMLFFHGLVKLWSRADFKYSFEWFMIRLASLGSGEVSERLDVDRIMNHTEWQRYGGTLASAARQTQELPG